MLIATLSTQRSGTKLLANCFKSGTVVTPFGEVFNPDVSYVGSFFEFMKNRGCKLIPNGNDELLNNYFESFFGLFSIVSIDVMFNQIEIPSVTWNAHRYLSFYGYLRNIRAVVISLERDILDSFVSMKYLEISGDQPHYYTRPSEKRVFSGLSIDEYEFSMYRQNVIWHRNLIYEAMKDYNLFYQLDYSVIANNKSIPKDLIEMIFASSKEHNIEIDAERIQIHQPSIFPSKINYSELFLNYHSIRDNMG